MAKIRGIKPETWTDEKFVQVTPLARLLFIGMWNFACDNGHLDDSPVQLKMRVLPADNADPAALLDELIQHGMVTRHDGFLKVPNLAAHQRVDARFLTLCDHCAHDENPTFTPSDKKGRPSSARRAPSENPPSTPSAPVVHTSRSLGDGDGDGDGDLMVNKNTTAPRKRGARVPEPFVIDDAMREWANQHTPGLDLQTATDEFVDYWRAVPGAKGTKLDWPATWRNRMREVHGRRRSLRAVDDTTPHYWKPVAR